MQELCVLVAPSCDMAYSWGTRQISNMHGFHAILNVCCSISNPTLELWELSNSASEAFFARKMMSWYQPTGPPEPLNYWSWEIKRSFHHSFNKYNHLCTHRWKVFFVAYCTVYCTVYCPVYTLLSTVLYTVLCIPYCVYLTVMILWARYSLWSSSNGRTDYFRTETAKEFSSNVEGDGPLTSVIRYISRKYTIKRRRLSSIPLKREAISALNEPPSKRQRIYAVANDLNSEQVRVSKRTLDSGA